MAAHSAGSSGSAAGEIGNFYDGEKKTATFRGRIEITTQLGIEPNVSLNWVDLPEADSRRPSPARARSLP